jgi:DNA-binding transcriptional ArsR family regulator
MIHNHIVVDHLSATFAALSDPTRRLIVNRLTGGPATVHEIAAPFSISQQAISKHLAYLKNARLIERQRDGRQNFCALNPDAIREVAEWAEGYRRFWEKNFQRLDVLLEEMKTRRGKGRPGGNAARVAGASVGARVTKRQKQHTQKGKR